MCTTGRPPHLHGSVENHLESRRRPGLAGGGGGGGGGVGVEPAADGPAARLGRFGGARRRRRGGVSGLA